jgi:hypothetical protein
MAISRKTARLALIAAATPRAPSPAGAVEGAQDGPWAPASARTSRRRAIPNKGMPSPIGRPMP